jgi:hypothetical protein
MRQDKTTHQNKTQTPPANKNYGIYMNSYHNFDTLTYLRIYIFKSMTYRSARVNTTV